VQAKPVLHFIATHQAGYSAPWTTFLVLGIRKGFVTYPLGMILIPEALYAQVFAYIY